MPPPASSETKGPPRPESLLDALVKMQNKVARQSVVKDLEISNILSAKKNRGEKVGTH